MVRRVFERAIAPSIWPFFWPKKWPTNFLSLLVFALALTGCLTVGRAGDPSATGSATGADEDFRESVRQTMSRHLADFEPCYEKAIEGYPGAAGKLVVRLTVSAAGNVEQAEIESSHKSLKAGEDCILERARTLKFLKRESQESIDILYPLVFSENGRSR
jgi:hypothetical protein